MNVLLTSNPQAMISFAFCFVREYVSDRANCFPKKTKVEKRGRGRRHAKESERERGVSICESRQRRAVCVFAFVQ